MNNVPRRNSGAGAPQETAERGRGRPRQWVDARERKAAHRAREQRRRERLETLFAAMLNARWDDAALQHTVHLGEDHEVLEALILHFQARHRK
jgi:hypothetical protein